MSEIAPINNETRALARILAFHRIDVVLDVGAQDGRYGLRLRQGGYRGWIVSFELVPDLHRALRSAAASSRSITPARLMVSFSSGSTT